MGHKYFKPKKISFDDKVISKKPIINEDKHNDLQNHYGNIIKIVNVLLEKSCADDVNITIEDNFISKSARKRPISNNKEHKSKNKKLEFKDEHIKLFTDVFSLKELTEYLTGCSNSDSSSIPVTDFEDIDTSLRDKFIDGSMKEVQQILTNLSNLRILLIEQKIHLELAEKNEYFAKLEFIMNLAARHEIITKVIDLKNHEGNTSLSIALLNGNLQAFCFLLLKRKAKISKFIYLNGEKQSFLNYVALNGKIAKTNSKIEYLLVLVLKELHDSWENETIFRHLTSTDSRMNICLPHLLLILFQSCNDLRTEINECIILCIKMCPTIYEIQSFSYFCPNYLFDLIAHCIILPVTNEHVLKELMKLQLSESEKQLYRDLCAVHKDPVKQKKLLYLIG